MGEIIGRVKDLVLRVRYGNLDILNRGVGDILAASFGCYVGMDIRGRGQLGGHCNRQGET